MESVLGRYRNLIILVGVLFLQALGLAVQVKRSTNSADTRLIRIWAVGAITPFERVLVWAQSGTGNLWHNYFFLRGVRAENRQLKEQIEQMRLEQVRLSEDAAQAHRLQALLAFKERYVAKTVPAQVIGSGGNDTSRVIFIDKGDDYHLKSDMAVITAGGIVGKVLMVYPSVSQVLLINDQSSGVGVLLEKSRLQGVLRGTTNGELVLERVMSDETVTPGETVLSSGGDQIFPKGMAVGVVSKVSPGKEMFLNITVKPAADLSRLEEVLVVTERPEREAVAEGAGKVRAADILAQRLPSVPDKPAAVAGAVPGESKSNASGQPVNGPAKPQANVTAKPPMSVGSVTGAASPGTPIDSNPASPAGTRNLTLAGRPATSDDLKKVVQKAPSGDAAANGNAGRAVGASASTAGAPPAVKTSSGPINAAPKAGPAAPKVTTKPAVPPATQPATTEDNPH